jgi:hypothetical protein
VTVAVAVNPPMSSVTTSNEMTSLSMTSRSMGLLIPRTAFVAVSFLSSKCSSKEKRNIRMHRRPFKISCYEPSPQPYMGIF